MKVKLLAIAGVLLLALGFSLAAGAGSVTDTDNDGAPDPFDNCINDANGPLAGALNQTDDDNDGIGTRCDCDYTQDNIVLGDDLLQLFAVFNQSSPPAAPDFDHDGDGFVLGSDTLICFAQFNGPPGPPTL